VSVDLMPLDHRGAAQRHGNAQASLWRAAALHNAFVQHFLEDLKALGANVLQLTGKTAATKLVIDLLPAQDRTGMLLRIIEGTDFGEHDQCSSLAGIFSTGRS
jgi:hypothetical protein